jgi:hypothetical protein
MNLKERPRPTRRSQLLSMAASLSQKCNELFDPAADFARSLRIHQTLTMIVKDNDWLTKRRHVSTNQTKTAGFPPPFGF